MSRFEVATHYCVIDQMREMQLRIQFSLRRYQFFWLLIAALCLPRRGQAKADPLISDFQTKQ
jgi:hypothetical protein